MKLSGRIYGAVFAVLCGAFTYSGAIDAWAVTGDADLSGPGLASGDYVATVDVASVNINVSHDSDEVLREAFQGESFLILADMSDGWLKVEVDDEIGYLPLSGNASINDRAEVEASEREAELIAEAEREACDARRQSLVDYSLQFLGGRYSYGGDNPNTGVDCSGFTRYVMKNGAGVNLERSSRSQSTQGVVVSASQVRPGDLIFYGTGSGINHVAMYIGNGQVVHSSTYKTGIKISNWNYRPVVKIVNVLGD